MPARKEDLPSTVERSAEHLRDVYEKALDSAHEEYGSGQTAGGVDAGKTKDELVDALRRHNDRQTARARS